MLNRRLDAVPFGAFLLLMWLSSFLLAFLAMSEVFLHRVRHTVLYLSVDLVIELEVWTRLCLVRPTALHRHRIVSRITASVLLEVGNVRV